MFNSQVTVSYPPATRTRSKLWYITHMEITDTHSHTWYSGHGEGTPAELVASAHAKKITTIALTEHLTLPPAIDPKGEYSLLPDQVESYLLQTSEAAATYPQLEVLRGCEVDWLHQGADFILTQLKGAKSEFNAPYQLVLGSVHALTGEEGMGPDHFWPFDTTHDIDGWYERGVRYVWEHYVRLWLEAVLSPVPFTVMAHPDLPKKLGFYPDFDASALWRQMAEAAAARGVMIELNTAGLYYDAKEVYPGPALLREFCRAGVPCTISSDAHQPDNVGRAHGQAVKAMLEAGYSVVTVPTADGDRREIPLQPY